MQASVSVDGESSSSFQVNNGVKQGCVLAPTLFSIMFTGMLKIAFQDNTDCIVVDWRTDGGGLFNLNRLKAKTRVCQAFLRDFLFADDCGLNTDSQAAMQRTMDKFSEACDAFGLTISIKKTEVLHQPAPGSPSDQEPPVIMVKGQPLRTVNKFVYLGSALTSDAQLDAEVSNQIAKACAYFGCLSKSLGPQRVIYVTISTYVDP